MLVEWWVICVGVGWGMRRGEGVGGGEMGRGGRHVRMAATSWVRYSATEMVRGVVDDSMGVRWGWVDAAWLSALEVP